MAPVRHLSAYCIDKELYNAIDYFRERTRDNGMDLLHAGGFHAKLKDFAEVPQSFPHESQI